MPAAPRPLLPLFALALGGLALPASGCEEDTHAHPDGGGNSGGLPADKCTGADLDTYAVGLSKATETGGYAVRFVGADPAPPDVGKNGFTVVLEKDGAPLDGVTVAVEPFMPLHDHGTNPPTFAGAATGTAGEYRFEDVVLFMGGTWTLTFHVAEGEDDHVVTFTFCLEG